MARKQASARIIDASQPWLAHKLTQPQWAFCQAYMTNGFNARQAYADSHPDASLTIAGVEGHRALTNPNIVTYLARRTGRRWSKLQMNADEALGRLATIASFDVRVLFDETGELIKPHLWPDAIRGCVKGISVGSQGTKFLFESPTVALRQILEIAGKLQPETGGLDALAAALRADIERRQLQARPPLTLDAHAVVEATVVETKSDAHVANPSEGS